MATIGIENTSGNFQLDEHQCLHLTNLYCFRKGTKFYTYYGMTNVHASNVPVYFPVVWFYFKLSFKLYKGNCRFLVINNSCLNCAFYILYSANTVKTCHKNTHMYVCTYSSQADLPLKLRGQEGGCTKFNYAYSICPCNRLMLHWKQSIANVSCQKNIYKHIIGMVFRYYGYSIFQFDASW